MTKETRRKPPTLAPLGMGIRRFMAIAHPCPRSWDNVARDLAPRGLCGAKSLAAGPAPACLWRGREVLGNGWAGPDEAGNPGARSPGIPAALAVGGGQEPGQRRGGAGTGGDGAGGPG